VINLFIDTNGYLNFYRYSNDDLEELRKLRAAVDAGEIRLFVTSQLQDEFRRNRETVIAQSLKALRESKLPNKFPQMARNYESYKDLREALKIYGELLSSLTEEMEADARGRCLHADAILEGLFSVAVVIAVTDTTLDKARQRFDLGNPPGKEGSYGDALNWLALLEGVPSEEDLVLITADADYVSKVNPSSLSEFLTVEWKRLKESDVELHSSLTSFFKRHFPTIKLASEVEKEAAIRRLAESVNFSETHAAIAKLSNFNDFSKEQTDALLQVALSNTQVKWIGEDDDVKAFYKSLFAARGDALDEADRAQFQEHFGFE
jgi:hypothetical protein